MTQETRKAQHTAGPWTTQEKLSPSENHRGFAIWRGRVCIGEVMPIDQDGDEGWANARLIAAAPELLDVLMAIDEWLDHPELPEPRRSRQAIRDIITKARGEVQS